MAKLHELLPEDVLENIRQRRGLEPEDDSQDEQFDNMSLQDIIEEDFAWEGIIGYGADIVQAVVETLVAFKEAKGLDIYDEAQRDELLYDRF